ncbi:MAG: hypothetical protein AAF458_00510 [Pseudomonadota bacterium]
MSDAKVKPGSKHRGPLRLRDTYAFFGPLVLMVELNMISKSAIHAFLARTDSPSVSLAAFNAAFTLYFAITSASELMALLCLSYLKSRQDVLRLIGFTALLLALPVALALLIALTSVGDTVYRDWFGLGPVAVTQARMCTGLLVLSMPVLLLRGTAFALLMLNRRTIIITWSTLVRLASLGLSLVFLPNWLEGAAIGGGALVFCMLSETVFAWCFCWRHLVALPPRKKAPEPLLGYWRFSWPLIINQSAEMGVVFAINLYLGRLAQAELAIAAFGVAHGLVSLLMGPMRNLVQTSQTLIGSRQDVRVMMVFTVQLIGLFALLALVLFHTPLKHVVLLDIMGLSPELAGYCEPAMQIAFIMAAFWSSSALFRGLLARARTTTALAFGGVLRVAMAVLAASYSLINPEVNGALLGVATWILSYVVETALSGWRLHRLGWYVETR